MRIKYLFFIVSVLSVFLGILLLTKKETALKIITSPKVFSMLHSSTTESFVISILSNKAESYHFDPLYIDSISLKTNKELIPLSLNDIHINQEEYMYGEGYYKIDFIVKVGFESDDYILDLAQTDLEIKYSNNDSISVYIGEVYYVFDQLGDPNLSLSNLSATYTDYLGKRTVSGIYLELMNKSRSSIDIKKIDIVSDSIHLNNDYSTVPVINIELFTSVEEIIGKSSYSFESYQVKERGHRVLQNNSVDLFIPLLYQGDITFIHRFALQVEYEIEGVSKLMYIDDFPYMNTSIFTPEYESEFRYYTYDTYS